MEDLIMQEEAYYEEMEDEGPEYDSAGFTEADRWFFSVRIFTYIYINKN